MRQKLSLGLLCLKVPRGNTGRGAVQAHVEFDIVGVNDFGRLDTVKLGVQCLGRAFGEFEVTAGKIEPGQTRSRSFALARHKHRRHAAVGFSGQERFVGECAGCHDPDNLALNRAFAGGRVADLFADCDRDTCGDEFGQILFGGMIGHARHRDRRTVGGAATRQRQIEQACATLGIFVKHFIEIPHAIEQQQRTSLRFETQILLHHGGVLLTTRGRQGIVWHTVRYGVVQRIR